MRKIYPVILCGGSGTRLWPLSRVSYPKQFLKLFSDHSMLQETALRVEVGAHFQSPFVITHQDYRFIVAQQLTDVGVEPQAIILEPEGKNTAAAVAIAALAVAEIDPEGVLLVMPSDHYIRNVDSFLTAVRKAHHAAKGGKIITFGIIPNMPETGYGYIKTDSQKELQPSKIEYFVEKPDAKKAETMIAEGGWMWNSGMFVFQADVMLKELEMYVIDTLSRCRVAFKTAYKDLDFLRLESAPYSQLVNISIDKAVMEKTDRSWVVPVNMGWSDVGSFKALADIMPKDEQYNVLQGAVKAVQVKNSFIRSDDQLITAVGVENLIVVGTKDAILIANREVGDDVRQLVGELKESNIMQASDHTVTYRPWGKFETVQESPNSATEGGYKVKRITVNPGAKLSLQKHQYRAEHWVVVRGVAEVTCNDKVFILQENQSTFIPLGAVHRLANPGTEDLEIIEVQVGDRCAEDDIIRLEDVYGRDQEAVS